MTFPKLKIFRINAIDLWKLSKGIQKSRNIVEFNVNEAPLALEQSMEFIKQIVQNNQLKKWAIPASVFLNIFIPKNHLDLEGMKLKSFEIVGWTSSLINKDRSQRFGEFLEMQSETLRYLAVGVTVNILQLMVRNFMDDSRSFEIMNAFVMKTPNVTHLEISSR